MMMHVLTITLVWMLQACGTGVSDSPSTPPVAAAPQDSQQNQSAPAASPAMDEVSPPPAAEPTAVPIAEPPPPAAPIDPVHELLDRLEKSATDLHSFTADIRYEKEDALLGRKELRSGSLIYKHDHATAEKSFSILFDRTIIDGVGRQETKQYIFNGRWLAEVDTQNKQFIKREIVAPGKALDPLKLGEGPFPLPIGQPKSEVLARFDVSQTKLPTEGLLKDLKEVDGMLLVPKRGGREAKEFARVELFYDRATLLPVGIITVETNDERKVIRLLNLKRNPDLSAEQLKRLDVTEPDPREWRVDVRPWQQQE